jgi:hypothetical protein
MKKLLLAGLVLMGLVFIVAPTGVSYADAITNGVTATCPDTGCPTATVDSLVDDIINIFSWVVGVVSVIMIIFGGFKYITSGGDAGKVTSAKNTILYALVGLVIAALAQVIVLFVLGNATT